MRYEELKSKIIVPIFRGVELVKLFPKEPREFINNQLSRMVRNNKLVRLKRGVYAFPKEKIDEFYLANILYSPSYVSLESALNSYGIVPDIPLSITSIATVTRKTIKTPLGSFLYSRINKNLYFGFKKVRSTNDGFYYDVATPEKALLDYIHVRKVKDLSENRVDIASLNKSVLKEYGSHFPKWVQKVVKENL